VTLDREFLKKGTVDKFPNQPGLVVIPSRARQALQEPGRLLLMVEGASIAR